MEWHYYLMVFMYLIAGIFHLAKPKVYLKIIPSYLPFPIQLIFWSGIAEIVLAIGLLFPVTKTISIYGVVLMLLIYLPVHIYMIKADPKLIGAPRWFSILRFPLQFVLIWWVLYYL